MQCRCKSLVSFTILLLLSFQSAAADSEPVLSDTNGDGLVSVLAFGDSITWGVGDGMPVGASVVSVPRTDGRGGYPGRVQRVANVPVENRGIPGEQLGTAGIHRLPGVIAQSTADAVTFLEGANDAYHHVSVEVFKPRLQIAINVIRSLGRTPVLMTLTPACSYHSAMNWYIAQYNAVVRQLAVENSVVLADLERAFASSSKHPACSELLNLPEGLHPNSAGYDVMADVVLASLFGIDIFQQEGPAQLEEVLGVPAGTVVVRPDVVS